MTPHAFLVGTAHDPRAVKFPSTMKFLGRDGPRGRVAGRFPMIPPGDRGVVYDVVAVASTSPGSER